MPLVDVAEDRRKLQALSLSHTLESNGWQVVPKQPVPHTDAFKPSFPQDDIRYWQELGEHRAIQEHEAASNPPKGRLSEWDSADLIQILCERGFLRRNGTTMRNRGNGIVEIEHAMIYNEIQMHLRPGGMGPELTYGTSGPTYRH